MMIPGLIHIIHVTSTENHGENTDFAEPGFPAIGRGYTNLNAAPAKRENHSNSVCQEAIAGLQVCIAPLHILPTRIPGGIDCKALSMSNACHLP